MLAGKVCTPALQLQRTSRTPTVRRRQDLAILEETSSKPPRFWRQWLCSGDMCQVGVSCVKLVVSDLHVSLKAEEIRMLVMLRMNLGFMEYMRSSYPDTPLSEFRAVDTYARAHGGVEDLEDDQDDE